MCLIIQKPKGVEIPYALIDSAWESNPDGAGIMYKPADAEPVIYKVPVGAWADPVSHIAKVLEPLKDVEVGLHFRWRTHGPISADMTHPYRLPSGAGWIMHNGILTMGPEYKPFESSMSDTAFFVANQLRAAPGAAATAYWHLVGADIGAHNRMLLLDAQTGEFHRINGQTWSLYKGLHLSNLTCTPEAASWYAQWRKDDNIERSYLGTYGTGGRSQLRLIGKDDDDTDRPDTTGRAPARLTRRERKVLVACLRLGHWGPFVDLGRGK